MKLKPKNVDEDVVTSGRRISENSSPKIFKKSFSTQICRKVIFWLFFCFPFLVDAEPFYSVKQPFREMASGMGHSVRSKSAWRRAWATGCVIKLLNLYPKLQSSLIHIMPTPIDGRSKYLIQTGFKELNSEIQRFLSLPLLRKEMTWSNYTDSKSRADFMNNQ